ncbi:MAG: cysteine synthase family protein, partial [Candidatus Izemoplasmatales bacterium]
NPSNNVKVRPAFAMINDLYEKGLMTKETVIIESSSGNTGIGLAMVGAYFDNKVVIVMPETVSKERVDVLKQYGADVVLTSGDEGIEGSNKRVKELLEEFPNSIQPKQFENEVNPLSHYTTTAVELMNDLGDIDYIFATVGTGGTVTGLGQFFKENDFETKIFAIEPKNSPVLSEGRKGKHKIQGAGPGFVPEIFNYNFVDKILTVSDEDAYRYTREVPRIEGISIGISSGACLAGLINYLKENKVFNKKIVLIFPDSGEKYFSTGVFN